MAVNYFDGQRGYPGSLVTGTDSAGATKRYVIPAMTLADGSGNSVPAGSATDPASTVSRGAASWATSQAATSISPAAATQLVAARSGRSAVTITNITGAQQIYILTTNAITGLTTGDMIPATVGASKTIPTQAAIFGTSPTAAQTVSILETF